MLFRLCFCLFNILSLFVYRVSSHSWAHCTNYHAVISGQDYDESECSGYIRQWQSHWGGTSFSTDRGVNYFGGEGAWCQTSFSSDIEGMYDTSDGFPYAEYYVGDTIRLVWPAKNHANYGCFNFIPDTSMKLYYVDSLSTSRSDDPSSLSDWTVLHDFQDGCTAGTDGCGFQNCPQFCDNTDGAPCFGDFEIKSEDFSQEGFYTFMWYWIFNDGTAPYTTCFEAYVHTSGSGGGGAATAQPTSPTTAPPTNRPTTRSPTNRPTTRPPTEVGETFPPTKSPTRQPTTEGEEENSDSIEGDWFIIVPLCYDGADYDKSKVINGANNAYGVGVTDWDKRELNKWTSGNGFNVSIHTFTDYSSTVTVGAYDYSTGTSLICDSIESQFSNIGTCTVCSPGEIRLYSTADTSEAITENSVSKYKINPYLNLIVITIMSFYLFW